MIPVWTWACGEQKRSCEHHRVGEPKAAAQSAKVRRQPRDGVPLSSGQAVWALTWVTWAMLVKPWGSCWWAWMAYTAAGWGKLL